MVDSGELKDWKSVNDIVNAELGIEEDKMRDESSFRKRYQAAKKFYDGCFSKMETSEYQEKLDELNRELQRNTIKFRDNRNAWNRQNYIDARAEQKLDYLGDVLSNQGKILFESHSAPVVNSDNDLLIQLSDLHIGQTFNSIWGEYNSDVAKLRLEKYLNEILRIKKRHNSENAIILLQGDVLSGNIHKSLQVTNRENVIEQLKLAIEYISSFCYELTKHFNNVQFYNVSGNHSRIDRKEDALHDERLDDLIGWDIGRTLSHIDNFHVMTHRNIDNGIADIIIRSKTYIAVHGDFDTYSKSGLSDLCMFLGFKPHAVLYGHMHHCSYDDEQGVKMIRSGCLSGSGDSYTIEKRLYGEPSQMVTVCSDYGVECCYPINL